MDIATATPVEIDTEIFRIYAAARPAWERCEELAQSVSVLRDRKDSTCDVSYAARIDEQIASAKRQLAKAEDAWKAAMAPAAPFEAEYRRRRWERAYWADVNNGHLHSSTNCGSLHHGFYRTPMSIEVSLSGKTHAEIVEAVGDQGCTRCYPSAPLAERPGLMSPRARLTAEEKAVRAAELAAKRAKASEKAIFDVDGTPLYTVEFRADRKKVWTTSPRGSRSYRYEPVGEPYAQRGDLVKTAVAARNKALEAMFDIAWYSTGTYAGTEAHPSNRNWAATAEKMIAALAVKWGRSVEDITAEFEKKTAAKMKKNGR